MNSLRDMVAKSGWSFVLAPPEVYVPVDPDVDLRADQLRAAAEQLVDHRASDDPLVAEHRNEWVDHVATFWQDAREKQALDAYTMVYDASGLPVKAFILAFGTECDHPDDIATEIRSLEARLKVAREGDISERDVSVVDLPAGEAVRMRTLVETDPGERRSLVVDVVEYWVPVPGHPDGLLLSFTTPVLGLADILADIADDVAQTLQIVH